MVYLKQDKEVIMSTGLIIFIVIVVLVIILIAFVAGTYNSLVSLKNRVAD